MKSTIAWSEVPAIFGGSFDPPTLGHREAVLGLLKNPGVKRVFVLPTGQPNLKNPHTSAPHRLSMAQLCFEGHNDVEVLDLEIRRSGPSYTYDTLLEFNKMLGRKPALAIGVDQLETIDRWHRYPEILQLAHWIVLLRKPDGETKAKAALEKWKGPSLPLLVETPAQEVSSTQIRYQIARDGKIPNQFLSPQVSDYIRQHRLYGASNESSIN